jgi:hypothetical protein
VKYPHLAPIGDLLCLYGQQESGSVKLFVVVFVGLSLVRKREGPWNRAHGSWGFFICFEGLVSTKLFIGHLSFHTTNEDLERLLSQAGTVASANIIMDKVTDDRALGS